VARTLYYTAASIDGVHRRAGQLDGLAVPRAGCSPPEAAGDQNVWLVGAGELTLAQVEHDTNFVA
jgi:hypothetical protein